MQSTQDKQNLIGQEGIAITDLRRIGYVKIGTEVYDAISQHMTIANGTRIKVIRRDFNCLVVISLS
ncbi:MAG: NfeD family protein [Bacteroidota bacterium]